MKRSILLITLLFSIISNVFSSDFSVSFLTINHQPNPLGVDDVHPHFSWQLFSSKNSTSQIAYRILVADDSILLQKNIGNIWDSKKQISHQSIQIEYKGLQLQSAKKYFWKVIVWNNWQQQSESNIAFWQMGLLKENDWKKAKWIAYENLPDSNIIVPHVHQSGKKAWGKRKNILPLFRTQFLLHKTIKSATAFISGLGHFELFINGEKIGNHFLDPGWTNYAKQALYVTFDVTQQLQKGMNAIGVMLGNGFYYIPSERYRKMTGAFGNPKLICRILVEYTDGTEDNIVSNEQWKTAASPILFSSIFGGEDYDATLEERGWHTNAFNDTHWKQVVTASPHSLSAQTAEPIKVMQVFVPTKITKIKPLVWVYDMAQNMSGIPFIQVKGKRGDTVKIIPSELLQPDGTVQQKATGGPHFYQYILKGDGIETWQPKFTYYGFRYIQVENVTDLSEKDTVQSTQLLAIKALHTSNSAARIGQFNCSNSLFNQTEKLIDWSIKSNMASVFTDCPHREKLGWLEQTHLMGNSVKYTYNVASLNQKVVNDMMLAQTKDGLIPEIAPEFVQFAEPFRDSPEWGSASIILPWYLYKWYGNKNLLANSFAMMHAYMQYLQTKDSNYILKQGLGDWFDLGPEKLGASQLTPKGLTATAIYYYNACIMQKVSHLIGNAELASTYQKLAVSIYQSFNAAFFNPITKQYGTGSQTSNAMALYMQLVPEKLRKDVLNNLIQDIERRKNALTAGDIGYRYVLKVLHEVNRSDVIFAMNNQTDMPGYGYQLAKGATALTESWQALPNVSNNHFMLGHLLEWFYEGVAGIQQEANSIAYKNIIIKPEVVGDLTHAKASFISPYGIISSDWKKEKN